MKLSHFALIGALGLAACATTNSGSNAAPSGASRGDLAGTNWLLETLAGAPPVGPTMPTLAFGENYRVTGSSGCNSFFGVYGVDSGDVRIREVGSTQMACEPDIMAQETDYLGILGNAASIGLNTDNNLVITGQDGRSAVFAPAATGS
jgi:heat shock protein HslJ